MADKKRRTQIDPAVGDLLSSLHDRREESPADRQRRAKERAKARRRNRRMIDLPESLTSRVEALAKFLETSNSQTYAALIALGLAAVDAGQLDLRDYRTPAGGPNHLFDLSLDFVDFDESPEDSS